MPYFFAVAVTIAPTDELSWNFTLHQTKTSIKSLSESRKDASFRCLSTTTSIGKSTFRGNVVSYSILPIKLFRQLLCIPDMHPLARSTPTIMTSTRMILSSLNNHYRSITPIIKAPRFDPFILSRFQNRHNFMRYRLRVKTNTTMRHICLCYY